LGIGRWENYGARNKYCSLSVFIDKDSFFEISEDTGFINSENEKDITIKPSSGNIAIFDSHVIHRVNEVLAGTRISTDITYMK
jgi:hypothetical protein